MFERLCAQKERNIFLLICHNCSSKQGNLTQPTWLSHDSNKNSCFSRETSCLAVLRAGFSMPGQYRSSGICSTHEKHKGFLKGGLQKLDHTRDLRVIHIVPTFLSCKFQDCGKDFHVKGFVYVKVQGCF